MEYNPHDWYWKRGDGRIYSSKAQGYVNDDDPEFQQFAKAGGWATDFPVDDSPERNESEKELTKVLAAYGIEMFRPTPEEALSRAKQSKKDAIDANTNRIRDRDGLSYSGERFAMNDTAQLKWTAISSMQDDIPFPFIIYTMDDEEFIFSSKTELKKFLFAGMLYESGDPNSPVVTGRILRNRVEQAQTVEEVNAIVDDRQ